jgi:general secretion pathway protein A
MYAAFFGLRELPFNNTPDPRYFFSTPDHEEALASLIYGVTERKGFVLLTGEVGAGKTLMSRMMLRQFGTRIAFANINHATTGAKDLMESVLDEFEIARPAGAGNAQLVRLLHDFLLAEFARNTPVVLVLDEAQSLSIEAFEQLRMIGNLEADDAKLLQICILGQPELRTLFASSTLRQLRQRLFRSFHLGKLTRELTAGYIRHRLTVAGAQDADLFAAEAIDAIHRHSQGLPRLINTLCDNAMLIAYSRKEPRITANMVASVIEQMMSIAPDMDVDDEHERATRPRAARRARPAEAVLVAESREHVAVVDEMEDESAARPAPRRVRDDASRPRPRRRAAAVDEGTAVGEAQLTALIQRVAGLEHAFRDMHGSTARMEDLLAEAQAAVDEGRETALKLAGGDLEGKKLQRLFQSLLAESRRVLCRMTELSEEHRRSERRVRDMNDRLGGQSERATRLIAALRQVLDRVEHRAAELTGQSPPPPRELVSGAGESPNGAATNTNPSSLERLLDNSRESLSDLRALLSSAQHTAEVDTARAAAQPPEPEEIELPPARLPAPAERLSEEVDSLLNFMEATRATAVA